MTFVTLPGYEMAVVGSARLFLTGTIEKNLVQTVTQHPSFPIVWGSSGTTGNVTIALNEALHYST